MGCGASGQQAVAQADEPDSDEPTSTFWRYCPSNGKPCKPRQTPSVNGERNDDAIPIQPNTVLEIIQEQQGEDGILYLQLASGDGWVFDQKPGLGVVCVREANRQSMRASNVSRNSGRGQTSLPGQPEREEREARSSLRRSGVLVAAGDEAAPPLVGGTLTVGIVSAKGLKKKDPFCVCQLRGKPETRQQTKHLSKTASPVWDEEHFIERYGVNDVLDFAVLHHTSGKAPDLLGQASVSSSMFDRSGFFEGDLQLTDSDGKTKATLHVRTVLEPEVPDAPAVSQPGCKLKVIVISATGLRAADFSVMGGKSDPFCVCKYAGKPDSRFQTRHLDKTLTPFWNEIHEMDDYEFGDPLEFTVFDYDRGSSADLLGHAALAGRLFDREGGFEGDIRLRECGKGHQAFLKVKVEVIPPVLPDAPPVSEPGCSLKIIVISATGLRAADVGLLGGKSDPFCVCQLEDNPDSMFQTRHIKKTLEPVWEEEHEIEDYPRGGNLEFKVMDYDVGSSADLLGRIVLPAREFDREGGFQGDLRLKEGGKGKQPTLKVKVVVVPPEQPGAPPVSVPGSRLKITIHGASGLRAADFSLSGGKSDPFCCCELVGKPDSAVQTRHINGTLEPHWAEVFVMDEYVLGDELEFRVKDYDRMKSADLLGKITLPTWKFDRAGGFSGDLRLKDTGKAKQSKLKVTIEVLPPELPDAPPVSEPGCRLRILIRSATGLRAADWSPMGGGKSDPYCICQVPGKKDSECETRVLSKTLDPVWDEDFQIDDYIRGDPLEFTVFDHDVGNADDLLGKVVLPCRNFDRDGGYEGTLRLKAAGKGIQATLQVKVVVLPADKPDKPPVSEPGSRLIVRLISARGLRAADRGIVRAGKSDPFCCCAIPLKPDTECETKYISKTLEPVWDEEFEIDEFDRGDHLDFWVCDYDQLGSNDGLGSYQLKSFLFDRDGGFDGELRLRDSGKGRKAYLKVQVNVLPPLLPPAPPISEPGSRLLITIVGARGLRRADTSMLGTGSSDPFCICQILGKEGCFVKTRHISKTLEPVWDQEFVINGYSLGDCLEFTVKDYDKVGDADLLGRTKLPCRDFDRAGGFHGELRLKSCGKKRQEEQKEVPTKKIREIFEIANMDGSGSLDLNQWSYAVDTAHLEEVLERLRQLELSIEDVSRLFLTSGGSGTRSLSMMEFIQGCTALKGRASKSTAFILVHVDVLPSIETERRLKEEAERERARMEAELHAQQVEGEMMSFADEESAKVEAAIVEMHRRQEEERQREAERKAKEEAKQKAIAEAAEAARLAAEAKARKLLENKEVRVALHFSFDDEMLAEVRLLYGSTVKDLAEAVADMAKLPFLPRLLLGPDSESELPSEKALVDAGVKEGEPLLLEAAAALTSSKDATAKVWNALTGECLFTLKGHEKTVTAVCATPDLKWIVTSSEDLSVKVWVVDRAAGAIQCLWTMRGHDQVINSVAYSQDGKWILTSSEDHTAKIWSVRTGQCKRTFEGHFDAVTSATFSQDGFRIYTQSRDKTMKIWEVETGRCEMTEPLEASTAPLHIALTALDGKLTLTSEGANSFAKYAGSGEFERTLEGHTDDITCATLLDIRVQPVRVMTSPKASRLHTLNKMKAVQAVSKIGLMSQRLRA